MATQGPSLVSQFDEIVASVNILSNGTEEAFAEFLGHNIDFSTKKVDSLKVEINNLKGENEAKDIKLKLSRNSLEEQMNECGLLKERLKEYEKQFTILKVLLNSDEKLTNLNEAERRSLALLKQANPISPGGYDSGDCPSPSDASINVTDATDLEDDEGQTNYRTKWKRRRTASVEWSLDSSTSKKRKSIENILSEKKDSLKQITSEVRMTTPLERQFKKPPPNKNRRKPSKGHLQQLANATPSPPPIVPPLNLPRHDDESPVPSAPSEMEVALANNGLLSSPVMYSPTLQPVQEHQYLIHQQPPPLYHEVSPASLHPQTPPMSSSVATRLYPALVDEEQVIDEKPCIEQVGSPTQVTSDINLNRKHVFFTKTLVKPESCQVCTKKLGFGRNCFKCKDCRAICHSDCKDKMPLPCIPNVHTPKKKHKESELSVFCPHSIPRVPSIIVHCVKEIESRGMHHVGIYRIPGSDRAIKELKERLLMARGSPNLDKVEDINVLCGCFKQFLIHLQEPLVTHRLHPLFMQANDQQSEELALAGILEAIAQLPPCNKDTLAFLILHLQKVAANSDSNKMPVPCLARVFAPTVVGSNSSEPDKMFHNIQKQQQVMERLLNISSDYWRQYLSPEDNPDPQSPTSCNYLSPPQINSPATPELMPIPQSPYLGPCQSPRGGRMMRTPIVIRSTSNLSLPPGSVSRSIKKGGSFFGGLN